MLDHDDAALPPRDGRPNASAAESLFAGGGEMGARMRAIDWSRTPLGPAEQWPQSLKTCVRVVLTSRQPMFVWWGDQLINLYNDAYKAIVGGKHPEALALPASVVWSEIWDDVEPRARSAMQRNEGTYDEALLLIMERNGYPEETYYTFSYSPVPNDQGGTGGILCANTDDTQRIIGERQLSLLRELGAAAAEARSAAEACRQAAHALGGNPRDLPFALIYLASPDRKSLVLMGSSGTPDGHVAAPAELTPSDNPLWPVDEVLHGQASQLLLELGARFRELPMGAWPTPPQKAVIAPIFASGEAEPAGVLIVGLNPMRLFDEAYAGFIGLVAGQISASVFNAEAYEQERRRAEALAELDRAKTAFFSNVSHEFRTPLTLMLGPLEDAMASPARTLAADNLETAYRNALRLLKLVNALLDFSRIEAGRAQAAYEPTNLAALTADLASAFRSAIERAGLAFQVSLPALAEPIHVDRDMWEKIVLNLLSNALKFTFDGSIHVALADDGDQVRLEVSDTGTGIPPGELGNVFKRFHRVQGTRSRTHEGSGIGLAMVSELVRLHGGSIDVKSEVGVGTTFSVRIPKGTAHLPHERLGARRALHATSGAEPYIEEARRWLPADGAHGASLPVELLAPVLPHGLEATPARILLADDNADMRGYLARLLRERWSVEAVCDGAEALGAARREPPDLVLSDVMMPNLDGFGLLVALRADPRTKGVPFIMLSARAGEESRVEGLEAGADDYLVKPFAARELIARVATHLTLAQLRKAAERERARLYEVFMQTPVAIAVLTGPDHVFEVANAAYTEMLERGELLGKKAREAFPELRDQEGLKLLDSVRTTGQPFRASELMVSLLRGGVLRDAYFDLVMQPLEGATPEQAGVVVVGVEVTEQVLARRKVEALRAAAEQASRAKDEFLSTLSHELRTPLNAIIGWAALLRKGGMSPERTERALETVERNAIVQARLIEDMLDLSRIEQGKLVLSVGPLELVRVVEAAIDAVRPAAEAKGVRLQAVLDSHATIVGDADRLQQVVWNLLSNAIKFTGKGGRVMIALHREHSHVEISVADSGEGIDPEFLPYVFDRFRQADPSFTRRAGGLGLGLAIVRSLVELHGGVVSAHSAGKGTGATLVVRLPMAPLREGAGPTRGAAEESVPQGKRFECPSELTGLSVLVVDDESETRELLSYLLEQCEARVTGAGSAQEALALIDGQRFDVLLSDIGMPEMDGYTLIRKVRQLPIERGGAIPAIALTAYARGEDRTKALKAGFNSHLAKPIEPSELLIVMATLVSGGYLRAEA